MKTEKSLALKYRACRITPRICESLIESFDIYALTEEHSAAQQLASELNHLLREAYRVASRLQRETIQF